MFPGFTIIDALARQQDLLRDGGYEPTRPQPHGEWIIGQYLRLARLGAQVVLSALAALGL